MTDIPSGSPKYADNSGYRTQRKFILNTTPPKPTGPTSRRDRLHKRALDAYEARCQRDQENWYE